MIIHFDTSALIDALTGSRRSLPKLTAFVRDSHRLGLSSLVFSEWLRGPRTRAELAAQEAVLPTERISPFDSTDARLAAELYRAVGRPRGREMDLAIAACALNQGAALWTLNVDDFKDVPGLTLV